MENSKKRGNQGFFKRNFLRSLDFIRDNKKYIYFIIWVFVITALIALAFPVPAELDGLIKEKIKSLIGQTEGLGFLGLMQFIFVNNIGVSFAGIFFGVFFCIFPFLVAAGNGYMLGYVIKLVIGKLGIAEGVGSLWRILPHGIFEIPAIIISLGIGIKLGVSLFSSLNKGSFKSLWSDLGDSARIFIFIVLPLLVIAAIIEAGLMMLLK